VEGSGFEEVEAFTYLGSVINKQSGTDADDRARIGEAIDVKLVLLYRAGTWRVTKTTINKVQTFIIKLRKMLQIRLSDTIINNNLWKKTNQLPAEEENR